MNRVRIFIKPKYLITLALGVLLLLTGCKAKSTELQTVENASSLIQLRTGKEVSRSLIDKRAELLGKPTYAEVSVEYEPVDSHTKEDVFNEIITILQNNNWSRGDGNLVSGFFKGSQMQGNSSLVVSVLIVSEKNLVSVRFVNME